MVRKVSEVSDLRLDALESLVFGKWTLIFTKCLKCLIGDDSWHVGRHVSVVS